MGNTVEGGPQHRRVGIVDDVTRANAAIAAAPRLQVRLENSPGRIADAQVDLTDDAGTHGDVGEDTARGDRRHAVGEFHLADRAQLLRSAPAVHGADFYIHRRANIVSRIEVGQKLVEQVAAVVAKGRQQRPGGQILLSTEPVEHGVRVEPQVMVRIDDRAVPDR